LESPSTGHRRRYRGYEFGTPIKACKSRQKQLKQNFRPAHRAEIAFVRFLGRRLVVVAVRGGSSNRLSYFCDVFAELIPHRPRSRVNNLQLRRGASSQSFGISIVAASLFGYFCTMVTACIVFMVALSHLIPPAKFRQPLWVIANTQSEMSVGAGKRLDGRIGGTRLLAHRSSVRAASRFSSIVN
jgi:hypothetical protein